MVSHFLSVDLDYLWLIVDFNSRGLTSNNRLILLETHKLNSWAICLNMVGRVNVMTYNYHFALIKKTRSISDHGKIANSWSIN